MISNRCKLAVKEELTKLGLHFVVVDLGEVEIMEDMTPEQRQQLQLGLISAGLELMDDKRAVLIERIINVITDMIHRSEELPKMNYSDYISEKLKYDYTYLSNLFSEVKGITIQQFIIIHKIEKVKEFLLYDELNLTEISHKMHYSSVAHLSNQFKKITGITPSNYKLLKDKGRKPIEEIGSILIETREPNPVNKQTHAD
jgi:AraC-like DNA-binding protein